MARTVKSDPLRNFKFRVLIEPASGSALASYLGASSSSGGSSSSASIRTGFSVVSGLTVQNEMIAYREGGMNTHPHKMIGQSDFGPVTFTKGVFADNAALFKWQSFMHTWAAGGGNPGSASSGSTGGTGNSDYRCDIIISIYDHPIANAAYEIPNVSQGSSTSPLKMAYKLHNCWPASYSLGDLNAGDSSILIQQLVVNHEGFQINWAGSNGTASDTTWSA